MFPSKLKQYDENEWCNYLKRILITLSSNNKQVKTTFVNIINNWNKEEKFFQIYVKFFIILIGNKCLPYIILLFGFTFTNENVYTCS